MEQDKRELFQKLRNKKLNDITVLMDDDYISWWRSVIEKYPESAHFIYELLQNADDVGASYARFILSNDYLIFKHNGIKHFDITDIENKTQKRGDINAICSLWSGKTEDNVTIGKFGVGFKSVFKYVDSPEIYDDEFRFRIDNYIVPTELETDHELRQKGETLFVLRFKESEKAYKHIEGRLRELKNPILYLNHLKSIEWKYTDDDQVYSYKKEVHKEFEKDGVTCEDVVLTSGEKQERLYLFTKRVELTNPSTNNKVLQNINVAYYLKEDGSLDVEKIRNIYCFFATSDSYGMCFESHGPFMLNESRTNILRDDNDVNDVLDDSILGLASQALLYLKEYRLLNENLFAIVPKETEYLREKGLMEMVKKKFKEVIKSNELVLSRDGTYKYPNKVRRSASPELERLIDKTQLNKLLKTENVDFVLVKNREAINNEESKSYFSELGIAEFNNDDLARCIDGPFFELQQEEWVGKFYDYLSENARLLWNKKGAPLRVKPILKTIGGTWESPYYNKGGTECPNVYLPTESFGKDKTDCFDFVDNSYFQKYEKFYRDLGLKEPNGLDYIEKGILPKYKKLQERVLNPNDDNNIIMPIWLGQERGQVQVSYSESKFIGFKDEEQYSNFIAEIRSDFFAILRVWLGANEEKRKKIEELVRRDIWIMTITDDNDGGFRCLCKQKKVYEYGCGTRILDDDEQLKKFYPYGTFVDYDFYLRSDTKEIVDVRKLFKSIGLDFNIGVFEIEDWYWVVTTNRIRDSFESLGITQRKDGLKVKDFRFEWLEGWPSDFGREQSAMMWKCICGISPEKIQQYKKASCKAKRRYFTQYGTETFECDSTLFYMLKHERWIYKEDGTTCSPKELTLNDFHALGYGECLLEKDLPFKFDNSTTSMLPNKPLFIGTPEQQGWQRMGKMAAEKGYSEDELKEALADFDEKRRRMAKREAPAEQNVKGRQDYQGPPIESKPFEGLGSDIDSAGGNSSTSTKMNKEPQKIPVDKDDKLQDYIDKQNKKIEEEKDKAELKSSMEEKEKEGKKYSKGWFLDGLKYEYLNSKEESKENKIAKSISLSFSKVTPEHSNVFCFSDSSQLIPRWLEEIDGELKVTLSFLDKNDVYVYFAMACVQDFSLRLRAKGNDEEKLKQIDWSKLTVATLDVNNPKGLVKNLFDAFGQLPFDNVFNMQKGLRENLKFVFGPPGTGKTYYLAHEIISKYIREKERCKILVLTPTNQAADVITKELVAANPNTYSDWLGRFVATNDQDIEDNGLIWDRKSSLYKQDKCCLVSTIARLSYDYFEDEQGEKNCIKDIGWDYVICDEGSMISLPEIIYAIYKFSFDTFKNFKGTQIVIAGDPKQLQPIDATGIWNAENIYDVVGLNSFKNPQTTPIQFNIVNLKEQRRSVPAVGELFSRYSYDGMLTHQRQSNELFDLHLDKLHFKPITYLPFYVNNFDDIYGAKKMSGSNIHIYSAMLTGELCRYIAKEYGKNTNNNAKLKIGVICPYIAQVQLIDKLLRGYNDLPSVEITEITVGTIHSFQGDECNMVFALFNPPKGMASKRQDQFTMLLNDDHLVNVAISRARDYLCVMVPDEHSFGRENLTNINKVADVIHSDDFPDKDMCGRIDCKEIERLIFGEEDYLKKHSFVTSHQMANVYTPTNYEYEIRVDDNAIDIQIANK